MPSAENLELGAIKGFNNSNDNNNSYLVGALSPVNRWGLHQGYPRVGLDDVTVSNGDDKVTVSEDADQVTVSNNDDQVNVLTR